MPALAYLSFNSHRLTRAGIHVSDTLTINTEEGLRTYTLTGTVQHSTACQCGALQCLTKDSAGDWCEMNDASVRWVSGEAMLKRHWGLLLTAVHPRIHSLAISHETNQSPSPRSVGPLSDCRQGFGIAL